MDVNLAVQQMLNVMKPIIGKQWDQVQQYATTEVQKLALTLAQIEAQKAMGTITEQQANTLLAMQKTASQAVLTAVAGLADVAASNILGVALAEVASQVNKALGFRLIPV
jgi:hypothetical protein